MKTHLLLVIGVALLAGAVGGRLFVPTTVSAPEHKESTFERVMRTGVLHCGYYVYPPMTMRDANTGELSGIAVDLMKRVGDSLSLKVDWTEEVTFGNMFAGLQSGRYDAICSPTWPSAAAARVSLFSRPLFYTAVMAYARSDDTRFSGALTVLNNKDVHLSVEEGDPVATAAAIQFPNASLVTMPPDALAGAVELAVVTKKADVTFIDRNRAKEFMRGNPGTLKEIGDGQPMQVYPFRLAVRQDEHSLNAMLDTALEEAQNNGFMTALVDKYDPDGLFSRVSPPYQK